MEAAKFDQKLSVALSDCYDLMAAEGKYHLKCYMQFQRNTMKNQNAAGSSDLAMAWLKNELELSAAQGHILEVNEIWSKYCQLCSETNKKVQASYLSRRASFTNKLKQIVGEIHEFHVLQRNEENKKQTVVVPKKHSHIPIAVTLDSSHETITDSPIPVHQSDNDNLLSLVHVALQLRMDILNHAPYRGANISADDVHSCIPENLQLYLTILYGGQDACDNIDDINNVREDEGDETNNDATSDRVMSVAQDIIYGVSRGKLWTPKHVGLGCSLHQATRSKQLVHLFHRAGHTISYKNVLQLDTAMANETLKSLDPNTGGILPANLVPYRFLHFTADNIDIPDSSLDGKDTFHATQVATWQYGPQADTSILANLKLSKEETLDVPEILNTLIEPQQPATVTEPLFNQSVQATWFMKPPVPNQSVLLLDAKEMTFTIRRSATDQKQGWTKFNQEHSTSNPQQTTVGYMPLILAPAHEINTLNIVVQRCKFIADALGQKHVVLTVDQALYCKLMGLKWAHPEYQEFLVPKLGGLHISMNFMKAIGEHMQSTGLLEIWTESNLLGPKTVTNALLGKDYEKGIRAHKITAQALWQIVLPQFRQYLQESNDDLRRQIEMATLRETDEQLIETLSTQTFHNILLEFGESEAEDPNFMLWWEYLLMVRLLLMFIRAERDGIWDLHIFTFRSMLPYFHRYDHLNYAKWGAIYLAEMNQLPAEVEDQFRQGHFVVKVGKAKFNQVDPDQAQEWLNGTGKRGGGIVGITKTTSALSRWALSFNMRAQIVSDTRKLYGLILADTLTHKEAKKKSPKEGLCI